MKGSQRTTSVPIWRFLLIAAVSALVVACSGGGGSSPTSQTNTQTKSLSLIWDQGSWDNNTWN
jgi:hypothetical protein